MVPFDAFVMDGLNSLAGKSSAFDWFVSLLASNAMTKGVPVGIAFFFPVAPAGQRQDAQPQQVTCIAGGHLRSSSAGPRQCFLPTGRAPASCRKRRPAVADLGRSQDAGRLVVLSRRTLRHAGRRVLAGQQVGRAVIGAIIGLALVPPLDRVLAPTGIVEAMERHPSTAVRCCSFS